MSKRDAMKEAVDKVEHDLFGVFSLLRRAVHAVDMVLDPASRPPAPSPAEPTRVAVNARVVRQQGNTIEVSTSPPPVRRDR